MSGFERSAPVKGSQGPRRSEMVRFNNAPPPETPWRIEVLKAKQEAEAARKEAADKAADKGRRKSRSRSARRVRSRSPPRRERAPKAPEDKALADRPAQEKGTLLRQLASQRGDQMQGWYAAVARASEAWESVAQPALKLPQPAPRAATPAVISESSGHEPVERVPDDDDHRRARRNRTEKALDPDEEHRRLELETRDAAERERRHNEEQEAMERKNAERRRKAEEEKRVKDELELKRKKNLKGAFAVDSDDDEPRDRERQLSKQAAGSKINTRALAPLEQATTSLALPSRRRLEHCDAELGQKLGFDNVVDPADAFIRLQERKRKGRRSEFGGPPRNCSPWRDGKRGVVTPLAKHLQEVSQGGVSGGRRDR